MSRYNGLVLKTVGGSFSVLLGEDTENKLPAKDGEIIECKARGIFRKNSLAICAGDICRIEDGIISEIMPRRNSLVRPPLANLDCLVFVVSTCEPVPNLQLLDKFIAVCEYKGIEPMIAITKNDIKEDERIADIYRKLGIFTVCADYSDESSYMSIKEYLSGKIAAFTGNTGVGKSTLLNHICPELGLATGEISRKLGRGRHTTRSSEIYLLDNGGFIADTPGFSSFETNQYQIILKDKLKDCFREFEDYEGKCRFSDCSHTSEKGCAVIEAVKNGEISESRHRSYLMMYEEAKNINEWEIGR
ncbi:MAG: ribosome small subunit-dependent GTPase A [Huintestinicola sp.]